MKKAIALVFMIIAMLIVTMLPKPVLSTPLGWKYFDNVISTLATLGTTTITTATITTANIADLAISGDFVPLSMSSTTIAAYTFAVGEVVYNTTRFAVCVGTSATGTGSAVFQSSNPITTAGVSCKE